MTKQGYREHCETREAENARSPFPSKVEPEAQGVTATDRFEKMNEGEGSGVLGRLPAATD